MGQRQSPELAQLLERVHAIGREVIAPAAGDVDRDARFPTEAFDALKEARLLSCYVPVELGGMGLRLEELALLCEAMGGYCASTAMIFAMHQIQVACVVHHALVAPFFRAFVAELVEEQLLLASATTELGIGGDVRTSRCAVDIAGEGFSLVKEAPVISYGEAADVILVTARRGPEALPGDQVHVLLRRTQLQLTPLSTWDTLGFRGTCSLGYTLRGSAPADQILPVPYAQIHAKTMHPFAHSVWASLWLGMAADAVQKARSSVRSEARRTPGTLPPSTMRLAELDTALFKMRAVVRHSIEEYQARLDEAGDAPFPSDFGFAIRINDLKVTASQLLIEVVGGAMMVVGIRAYRNDDRHSLARQLRDAYGASLMVHNDRILGQSATMHLVVREG